MLARIYQQFRLRLADPSYQLRSVQTLTMKPRGLYMVVEKRTEEKGKLPTSIASQQQQHGPSIEGQGAVFD